MNIHYEIGTRHYLSGTVKFIVVLSFSDGRSTTYEFDTLSGLKEFGTKILKSVTEMELRKEINND